MATNKTKARVYLAMVQDRVINWQKHDDIHHNPNHEEHGHFDPKTMTCTLRDAENEKEKADKLDGRDYPQVSSEARHSTKLVFGKWLENGKEQDPYQTYKRQLDFQRETQVATNGLFADIVAVFGKDGVGIRKVGERNLVGYFEQNYTDGLQEEIELPIETDKNGNQRISDNTRKVMDAYCAMQALLRRQDAVTWNAPLVSNDVDGQNGFYIDAGNYIDMETYQDLFEDFNDLVNQYCTDDQKQAVREGNVGFISTRRGVRIIDFQKESLKENGYGALLTICEKLNAKYGNKELQRFSSDGGYIWSENYPWSEDDHGNGRAFIELLEKTGEGEQLKRLYAIYAKRVYAAECQAAKRLGYNGAIIKQPIWE